MSDPNIRFDLRTVKRYINSGRIERSAYQEFVAKLEDSTENITATAEGGDDDGFEDRGQVPAEANAESVAPPAAVGAPAMAPAAAAPPAVAAPAVAAPAVAPPMAAPPLAAPPVLGDSPAPPPPPLEVPIVGAGSFGPPKVD